MRSWSTLSLINPNSLDDYQRILARVERLTPASKHLPIFLRRNATAIDSSIENLIEARNLMCQLCDSQGSIRKDVAETIEASIKPDIEIPDKEMWKGLSCLSSIFSTLHYIALIDQVVDRQESPFIDRTSTGKEIPIDVRTKFLDTEIVRGQEQALKRRVLVDIMHDAFKLLDEILFAVKSSLKWGEGFKERRLDKFCDQNGKYFMNCTTVQNFVDPSRPTKVFLETNPEHQHFLEFWEIIETQLNRFKYIFKSS